MDQYFNNLEINPIVEEAVDWYAIGTAESMEYHLNTMISKTRDMLIILETIQNNQSQYDSNYTINAMYTAYSFIQSLRQSLTGEIIKYRYYNTETKQVQIFEVNEEQLYHMLSLEKGENLSLRLTRQASQIQGTIRNRVIEQILQKHQDTIMNSLEYKDSRYVVNIDTAIRYGGMPIQKNPYYVLDKDSHKYRRKKFNQGWIMQAFDSTIQEKYKNVDTIEEFQKRKISNKAFEKEYFSHQLKYDNIRGFKGGDKNNWQIKACKASLIKLGTIIEELKELEKILTSMQPQIKKAKEKEIKNSIKERFTSEQTTRAINEKIDKTVNQILSTLSMRQI